uniref:Uncharacterized protein n=1 Tax=Meloidogyne incognita TaxID=6306 RepID=A0A914MTA7_MELIC
MPPLIPPIPQTRKPTPNTPNPSFTPSNQTLSTIFLCLLDHTLNLIFGKTSLVISDGDLVLLSSRLVLGRNIQNSVGVNVKSDFDLRNTTRSRRNSTQLELAQQVVVLCHSAFTFIDL